MLRTAIIGVGWAGRRHIQAIRELNRKIDVACLVDSDAAHLSAAVDETGVGKTYAGIREALADPDIDAVSICTPHALHCPMAVAAAEAGKHVLCEKPMAVTVDEATQMIEAADRNGVTLFVAENAAYSRARQVSAQDAGAARRGGWRCHRRADPRIRCNRLRSPGLRLSWSPRVVG